MSTIMDEKYYSPKTVDEFARQVICMGKADMFRAWMDNDPVKWRKLARKHKMSDAQLEKMLYVLLTDTSRGTLYQMVAHMTSKMLPLGEMIIGGGEAFNHYSPREQRIVTSDIDTKFVPAFKFGKKRTFLHYQCTRLLMWDQMEGLRRRFNSKMSANVRRAAATKLGRFLNLSASPVPSRLTRRYTLKGKEKQQGNTNNVSPGNTLADIEIFALDITLGWWHPEQNKTVRATLGGMLDAVLLRRDEMGADVWDDRVYIKERGVMMAGKKYLIDDLYLLNKLGLRKEKADKDRKRMYIFSKYVLKIPGVRSSMSTDTLFKHIKPRIAKIKATPRVRKKFQPKLAYDNASKVNPLRNEQRGVSKPKRTRSHHLALSLHAPRGLKVPGYKETAGDFRFNTETLKWVRNRRRTYIHNEETHRINKNSDVNIQLNDIQAVRLEKTLRGYNPTRDNYIPVDFRRRAALIQFAGLPDKKFVK